MTFINPFLRKHDAIRSLIGMLALIIVGPGCSSDNDTENTPSGQTFGPGNGGTATQGNATVTVSDSAFDQDTVVTLRNVKFADFSAELGTSSVEALPDALEISTDPVVTSFDADDVVVMLPCDAEKSSVRIIQLDNQDDDSWEVGTADIECDASNNSYTFSILKPGIVGLAKLLPAVSDSFGPGNGGTIMQGEVTVTISDSALEEDATVEVSVVTVDSLAAELDDTGFDIFEPVTDAVEITFDPLGLQFDIFQSSDDVTISFPCDAEKSSVRIIQLEERRDTRWETDTSRTIDCDPETNTWTFDLFNSGGIYALAKKVFRDLEVEQLSLAGRSSCAVALIDDARRLACWGVNGAFQLGIFDVRTNVPKETRNQSGTIPQMVSIKSGNACAIVLQNDAKAIRCWGENDLGQLGMGPPGGPSPETLTLGGTPQSVSLGNGSLYAIVSTPDGNKLKAWGNNNNSQLGLGDNEDRGDDEALIDVPFVDLGGSAESVAAGNFHACAVVGSNPGATLACWGSNGAGQLGIGNTTNQSTPQTVTLDGDIEAIALGGANSCVIVTVDGERQLQCWGDNSFGQLGLGNTTNQSTPQTITLGGEIETVAVGEGHICAGLSINDSSKTKCWGQNDRGQLGLGDEMDRGATPQTTPDQLPVVQF